MAFDIVQLIYWLLLSAWFGLVLFGAMASPAIFKTVQEADPTLPTVLSVNLDGQHGALLAMTINAQILTRLLWLQLVCAGGLLVSIAIQWFLAGRSEQAIFINALRSALLLAAIGLLIYGWRSVWPRMAEQRRTYIDNADDPEVALPARDQLTRLYRESEIVQLALATVLSALILFSTSMGRTVVITTQG
ncbi:hypothetical protein [Humisphaera borealis]|uniref:DUF4149 domain-containing protein n=1 Tax=Humisphaera borealis TaxID=2807512 RepID=A0A7M2WZS4_9BACT|nr:hypothetical protein [Humisphaera borealis]QOV89980.1 hypothetical protein IPV69_00990 [Humisphaera borealis]